ncbi:Uncharacterized conserved protein (UCP012943) [Quillaja saponaria]|uniref:Uncharacterized conserved protein (UCP012943) n=1 Tax=Quillaja saponaria TaxID=32244 RepID=A0AAD7LPS8_QUISA|nr:Uncharacterized conserved protein (UCP012943) [Quillaja saponaria]
MGGGAMHLDLPKAQLKISSNYPSKSSSSSASSNPNFSVPSCSASSCYCHSETSRKLESDGRKEKRASGIISNHVFQLVPSQFEVEKAVSALQNFMRVISSSGTHQQIFGCNDSTISPSHGQRRICDALQLLQIDPSIKRLVVSLSSDKAVWDSVMNVLLQKLQELRHPAQDGRPQLSSAEQDLEIRILRWIFDIMQAKVMELIQNFQSLMNDLFQHHKREKTTIETTELEEKIRSSLLLSVVIILIVIMVNLHTLLPLELPLMHGIKLGNGGSMR